MPPSSSTTARGEKLRALCSIIIFLLSILSATLYLDRQVVDKSSFLLYMSPQSITTLVGLGVLLTYQLSPVLERRKFREQNGKTVNLTFFLILACVPAFHYETISSEEVVVETISANLSALLLPNPEPPKPPTNECQWYTSSYDPSNSHSTFLPYDFSPEEMFVFMLGFT